MGARMWGGKNGHAWPSRSRSVHRQLLGGVRKLAAGSGAGVEGTMHGNGEATVAIDGVYGRKHSGALEGACQRQSVGGRGSLPVWMGQPKHGRRGCRAWVVAYAPQRTQRAMGTTPQMPATRVCPWAWARSVRNVLLKPAHALRQRSLRAGPRRVTA